MKVIIERDPLNPGRVYVASQEWDGSGEELCIDRNENFKCEDCGQWLPMPQAVVTEDERIICPACNQVAT